MSSPQMTSMFGCLAAIVAFLSDSAPLSGMQCDFFYGEGSPLRLLARWTHCVHGAARCTAGASLDRRIRPSNCPLGLRMAGRRPGAASQQALAALSNRHEVTY